LTYYLDEALFCISKNIDSLSDKLQDVIKTINSDLLLRKLTALFNVTKEARKCILKLNKFDIYTLKDIRINERQQKEGIQ
jgi:Fe2+ transport system protein B